MRFILVALVLSAVCAFGPNIVHGKDADPTAATLGRVAADPELAARNRWRLQMQRVAIPAEGCYHASYPEMAWKKVECDDGTPRTHLMASRQRPGSSRPQGARSYSIAQGHGLISIATGLFPAATVHGEESILGIEDPIDGPNEYTLQLNTNNDQATKACAGHAGCAVWEQFVYATDYLHKGSGDVYIQFWLLNFGSKKCPAHFRSAFSAGFNSFDCYRTAKPTKTPDIPPQRLGGGAAILSAVVSPNGTDAATLFYGSEIYTVAANDSILDISSVWNAAEFNILGDAGGTVAEFDPNTSVTVLLSFTDGTSTPPLCFPDLTTTGESSNLVPQSCQTGTNQLPFIEFTETTGPPAMFTCAQLHSAVTAAEDVLHAAQAKLKTLACQNGASVDCLRQVTVAQEGLTAAEGKYKAQCDKP
jgi:hypothetical protein